MTWLDAVRLVSSCLTHKIGIHKKSIFWTINGTEVFCAPFSTTDLVFPTVSFNSKFLATQRFSIKINEVVTLILALNQHKGRLHVHKIEVWDQFRTCIADSNKLLVGRVCWSIRFMLKQSHLFRKKKFGKLKQYCIYKRDGLGAGSSTKPPHPKPVPKKPSHPS